MTCTFLKIKTIFAKKNWIKPAFAEWGGGWVRQKNSRLLSSIQSKYEVNFDRSRWVTKWRHFLYLYWEPQLTLSLLMMAKIARLRGRLHRAPWWYCDPCLSTNNTLFGRSYKHVFIILKIVGHLRGPFFIYFWYLANKRNNLYNNFCVKKCPYSTRRWDSNSQRLEHESLPITTRWS